MARRPVRKVARKTLRKTDNDLTIERIGSGQIKAAADRSVNTAPSNFAGVNYPGLAGCGISAASGLR